MGFYDDELPLNYEQKCPVVLVLDRSTSMSNRPIEELNQGLKIFEQEVIADKICASRLELAVISFGSDHRIERDFGLISEGALPQLSVSGSTKLVDAMRAAIQLLNERKRWYKDSGQTCYRPYIVLITDGAPDRDQDIPGLSSEIRALAQGEHLNFWPIGIQGADMEMLSSIAASDCEGSLPPMMLEGYEFAKLFKWLSTSFSMVSRSRSGEKVDLTPEVQNNPFQFKV